MFRRCVSYASRMYNFQSRRGEEYDVAPVYLIGLMGVDVFNRDAEQWKDRYISEYTFREKETHDLLDETIIIIFAEIARFSKEKRIQYDKDMYDEKRLKGELNTARREGKTEGLAEGRAEAIRTMIASGVPVETIAKAFGMTVDE